MDALRRQVLALDAVIPRGAAIAYLDYPVTNNIGDVLIMLGAECFFRANGNRFTVSGNADNGLRRLRGHPAGAPIVLHGGGNLGDLYPGHERFRRAVVAARPDCPVVILPQTVHFRDPAEAAASARIYRAHPDLVLCVRDETSREIAQRELGLPRVVLAPDMAHLLWPLGTGGGGDGELRLLRTDGEATAADGGGCDWNAVLGAPTKTAIRLLGALHRLDGRVPTGLPLHALWCRVADRILAEATAAFAPWRRIVTSRLHGHILACLMGKETVLIDNSYGKNRAYWRAWTRRYGVGMPGG